MSETRTVTFTGGEVKSGTSKKGRAWTLFKLKASDGEDYSGFSYAFKEHKGKALPLGTWELEDFEHNEEYDEYSIKRAVRVFTNEDPTTPLDSPPEQAAFKTTQSKGLSAANVFYNMWRSWELAGGIMEEHADTDQGLPCRAGMTRDLFREFCNRGLTAPEKKEKQPDPPGPTPEMMNRFKRISSWKPVGEEAKDILAALMGVAAQHERAGNVSRESFATALQQAEAAKLNEEPITEEDIPF